MVREFLGLRAQFSPFIKCVDGAPPLPLFGTGEIRGLRLLGSVQLFMDRLYDVQCKTSRTQRLGHPQVQGRVLLVVLLHFQAHGDCYLCCFDKTARYLPVSVRASDKNGVRRPYAWLAPGVDEGFVKQSAEITEMES